MDILIACRSIAADHPVKINTEVAINCIHYDGTTDMSTSLENFYDMVWCKGCPIYTPFNPPAEQVVGMSLTQRVLVAAQRVLKVGGIFVMPLNPKLIVESSLEVIMDKARKAIVGTGHWSMELTKIADMPVHVESTYKDALVFTKTMKGGGRRLRKTMRRR